VLVGLSRVYLGKHYPSQVLAGAAIGVAVGGLGAWLAMHYRVILGLLPIGEASSPRPADPISTEMVMSQTDNQADSPPHRLSLVVPLYNELDNVVPLLAGIQGALADYPHPWGVIVVDDGSSDGTTDVAQTAGVHHVVRHPRNLGLARAFMTGLDSSLRLGADIIVNTDADNQYSGADIAKLVAPILSGDAEMVVGDREVADIDHFSPAKKSLQKFGSWVVRRLSDTDVTDATSGFRAYDKEAALQLLVVDSFTYTLESLIQAGKGNVAVGEVRISTNPKTRESRLFGSTSTYVRRNALAILRIYTRYEPLKVFSLLGLIAAVAAIAAWMPFLIDWIVNGDRDGHIQSLLLGAVLFIVSIQLFALGIIGDLLAGQRVMTQRVYERVRRIELELEVEPSHRLDPPRDRSAVQ